jgi:hypothetical protein
MVNFNSIKQKAKIILNSDDAVRAYGTDNVIPVREDPIRFDGGTNTIVDVATDKFNVLEHRLYQGEALLYTTGATAIGGLTTATTYYVIVISNNAFKLATSLANANAGTAIDITGAGTGVQTFARTLTFDGSSAAVVDVTSNIFNINAHALNTGDYIQYGKGTTIITGLTDLQYYYVVALNANAFQLAVSFQNATATTTPPVVDIAALGAGANHTFKKAISFDSTASPVVDIVNERIQIPAHNLNTGDMVLYQVDTQGYAAGTAIGGLADNMYYYVISVDTDSIRLAESKANALASPATYINLTAVGTGNNHALTRITLDPVQVCTNYKFKLDALPNNLNDKCRLVVQSFNYVKNYPTANCKSVGGVYIKSIPFVDTYTSQGSQAYYKGTMVLPAYFGNTFTYSNNDADFNSVPVNNITQLLQNGIDVFIDSKKRNFYNQDIAGCINDDAFSLTLLVYELDDYDYKSVDLNEKTKNTNNPRWI